MRTPGAPPRRAALPDAPAPTAPAPAGPDLAALAAEAEALAHRLAGEATAGAHVVRGLHDVKATGAGDVPACLAGLSDDTALAAVVEMVATLRRAHAVLGGAVGHGNEVVQSDEWELVQLVRAAAHRVHVVPTTTPSTAVDDELARTRTALFSSSTATRLCEPALRSLLVRAVAWKTQREKPPSPTDGTRAARWLEPIFDVTVLLGWEAKPAPGYEDRAVWAWSRRLPTASIPLDEGDE